MKQKVVLVENEYDELDVWIKENNVKKIMLVCGRSVKFLTFFIEYLGKFKNNLEIVLFSDFCPNPLYESVAEGVELFRSQSCDAIIAVGGGSAIDVAKCIKLYRNMSGDGAGGDFLKQEIIPDALPFLAMPTTAGAGSEATRFAVIYFEGTKQSISSESMIPGTVLLDGRCLKTLPIYQKKATMMDAFSHAIESFWSINSTEESKKYSREAIRLALENMDGYLANTEEGNRSMLLAAYMAGKAINITQTTAGHAMCYKITSLFRLAHGHAAILCNRILFSWMLLNMDKCVDPRGKGYLVKSFGELAHAMGCDTAEAAAERLQAIFDKLELTIPRATEGQYKELLVSVNPVRLRNHPIELTVETIDMLYHKIILQ